MIIKTEQIYDNQIDQIDFDLLIASSGYESRGSFLFSKFNVKSIKKIVLGFENYRDNPIRLINDAAFEKMNFEQKIYSGNDDSSILKLLKDTFESFPKSLNVLIDYSCMTRVWYAAILNFFNYHTESNRKVNLYFSYSFSEYLNPPAKSSNNKFVAPIDGFYSISVPSKPTALIIGLGYVADRAFGLAEYFDVLPNILIADTSLEERFYNDVITSNKELLNTIPEENIFLYPLGNLKFTETLLNHLCKDLLKDYRIVIAPCGPKPFTLISLITSLRLNEVDVWRISAGENDSPLDKKANGKLSMMCLTLKSDDYKD